MYGAQHSNRPLSAFTGSAIAELKGANGQASNDDLLKELKTLVAGWALTNRLLAVSYGSESGIADRRSGQSYFVEVGWLSNPLTDSVMQTNVLSETPRITVNLSRIAQLVSPSLGDYDISFTIGVDSFFLQRDNTWISSSGGWKGWPLAVRCPSLQGLTGSRYLTLLVGDSGSSLSGTASVRVFGELPSILEFEIGFMKSIPTDANGNLDNTLLPCNFTDAWLIQNRGKVPSVPDTDPPEPLWSNAAIVSGKIRFYCFQTITPRTRLLSQSPSAV